MIPTRTLEDEILDCWHITDELHTVFEAVVEDDDISRDEIANILLGLQHLYSRKFDRLFRKYEESLRHPSYSQPTLTDPWESTNKSEYPNYGSL